LASTLPHGGTLPRGTNNAMCHTKDLTHDNFIFKKKIKKLKKLKKPKADTWHAVNGVCKKLIGCTTLMHKIEFGY